MEFRFQCPKCGSSCFSSSVHPTDHSKETLYCKGTSSRYCNFSTPRIEEYKYFKLYVDGESFKSQRDYRETYLRLANNNSMSQERINEILKEEGL